MDIFDKTFTAIEKRLDLTLRRHSVLAGNVANSETPNYKARDLDFAGELEKALGHKQEPLLKTNAQHLDLSANTGSHIVLDNRTAVGADGNNVDLDIATSKLSQNAGDFTESVEILNIKLRMLRMAARGRAGF